MWHLSIIAQVKNKEGKIVKTAVFPGTFDPLTLGHFDLIKRSSKIFDKVLLTVCESPAKHCLFSFEDRIEMAKKAVADLDNVEAVGWRGTLPDFLKERQATILIRGVRTVADYDYEKSLSGMYHMVMPEVEIVMLPASGDLSFISSTFVRDLIIHKGEIEHFVPKSVSDKAQELFY